MKRIIKWILAIIIALGAASPYFVGRIVEKDFHQLIERINAANQGQLKVSGNFVRGYFTSTATTEVTFTNSYSSLQLAHLVQHGPVIFNFNGWLSPSSYIPRGYKLAVITSKFVGNQEQMLNALYGGKQAYDIVTRISMHGDIDTEITNHPLSLNLGMGSLNWQGFKANIHTTQDFVNVHSDVNMPMIQYTEAVTPEYKQSVSISNMKVSFADQVKEINAKVKIDIDSIKITVNDAEELSLQKYAFSVDRQIMNNMLNVAMDKNFAKLIIGKDVYGPFNVALKLKNWNATVTRQLMQEPEQELAPDSGEPIVKVVPDAQLLELLASKIGIDFELSLDSADGKLLAKMQSELGGPGITELKKEQVLPTLNNTTHIEVGKKVLHKLLLRVAENQIKTREIAFFTAYKTSTIKNPYTLSAEDRKIAISNWSNELIAQLMAKNFLIAKDENYIIDVTYADNILKINGAEKTQADIDQLQPLFEVIPPVAVPPPASTPTPAPAVTPQAETPAPTTSGTAPIPVATPPAPNPKAPDTDSKKTPAPVTPNPPVTTNPGPSTPSGPSATSITNTPQ